MAEVRTDEMARGEGRVTRPLALLAPRPDSRHINYFPQNWRVKFIYRTNDVSSMWATPRLSCNLNYRCVAQTMNSGGRHRRQQLPHIGFTSYLPGVPFLNVCYRAIKLRLPRTALGRIQSSGWHSFVTPSPYFYGPPRVSLRIPRSASFFYSSPNGKQVFAVNPNPFRRTV